MGTRIYIKSKTMNLKTSTSIYGKILDFGWTVPLSAERSKKTIQQRMIHFTLVLKISLMEIGQKLQ